MNKEKLCSKKGASSIMVILLMVVLVVFGVAALTTALSGLRLGQKVDDWNVSYYSAEAAAYERFAEIDKAAEHAYAYADKGAAAAVAQSIDSLGYAKVSRTGSVLTISYETWSSETGISTVLELDVDKHSLEAVQWKEIQQ